MHYKYAHPELFQGVPKPDFAAMSGNLIIYGAGFQGLLAVHLLNKQGIQVLCFGDQDVKKQGTTYYGLPVYSPEEMKRRYPNAVPIVTPYNLRPAFTYVKKDLGYDNAVTPFSLFLEFDSGEFDKLQELPSWYHADSLDYTVDMFLKQCANLLTSHRLLATDISVTEVCNLRCKNCISLMPNYQKPRHFELEDVLRDAYTVLNGRKFHHIFLEGGEVFLWKPLPKLIQKLCEAPELMNLILITNGTVIPGPELLEALQHPKVEVRISDYGAISRKEQLIPLLEKHGIRHWLQLQKWYEMSAFYREPLSGDAYKNVINACCKLNDGGSTHIADGKLFRCPIQAHLHRLGFYVSGPNEYVDLRGTDYNAVQEKITRFMELKTTLPAVELCRHCNGRGYTGTEVPPAEQLAPGEQIQVRFE